MVLDCLNPAPDFIPQLFLDQNINLFRANIQTDVGQIPLQFFSDLFPTDINEGRQMGQRDGLAAVLVGSHLCDNLGCNVASCRESVRSLNQSAADDGSVLKHVLQIDQVAVVHMLSEVVRIMEVEDALFMGLHNIGRKKQTLCDVPRNLTGHVVSLGRVHHRVLVGVFLLYFLITTLDETENLLVSGVGAANQGTCVAVGDIALRHIECTMFHNLTLDKILNLLHRRSVAHSLAGFGDGLRDFLNLRSRHAAGFRDTVVRLRNRISDFFCLEDDLSAISFDDGHVTIPLWKI